MMNSGGGSGELQAIGLRFINTFMESAENAQNRLYLQAELYQAGMEPQQMSKLISSTSPWLEKLLSEIKRFDSIRIDIDELQKQVRSSEQVRNKLVILERKVDALHEEKLVFTSIERRLQEKCAELQRELLQLKKKQKQKQQGENNSDMSTLEKRPVALPRQNAPNEKKKDPSENEDEGISSSETGPSMSPEPPKDANGTFNIEDDAESTTTIDDVIEELKNIVDDAEREIVEKQRLKNRSRSEDLIEPPPKEYEIVPVNLLPQPPKKSSKSLINVFAPTSVEGSDYDISFIQNNTKNNSLFEEDEELAIMASRHQANKTYETESKNHPDLVHTTCHRYLQHHKHQQPNLRPSKDENRAILNVIMDAREKEQRSLLMMNRAHSLERDIFPPQHFNGVFFMADMNSPKFPKPDITAALEAKRVTKNLDRMGSSYGLDSMIDIVMTSEPKIQQKSSHKSGNNNFNFKNSLVNAGLYSGQYLAKENSRAQSNVGSKVTDLLSGLY